MSPPAGAHVRWIWSRTNDWSYITKLRKQADSYWNSIRLSLVTKLKNLDCKQCLSDFENQLLNDFETRSRLMRHGTVGGRIFELFTEKHEACCAWQTAEVEIRISHLYRGPETSNQCGSKAIYPPIRPPTIYGPLPLCLSPNFSGIGISGGQQLRLLDSVFAPQTHHHRSPVTPLELRCGTSLLLRWRRPVTNVSAVRHVRRIRNQDSSQVRGAYWSALGGYVWCDITCQNTI